MPSNVLRWVTIGLWAVFVLAVAGAYLIPRHPVVTRTIEIDASPDAVFKEVGDLRRFAEWSPWRERDPEAAFTFTGPIDGVGQTLRWQSASPAVGAGTMTVDTIEDEKQVDLTVVADDLGPSTSWFTLEPHGATTALTWGFTKDLGLNPLSRYLGTGYDEEIGPVYEAGLAELKALVERPEPTEEEE